MSTALIDNDCLANKKDFFYDLDIMKLASYYKSKKEITKLLLNPTEYYQYTRTYFIKNRFDYKLFKNLFTDPRIFYRGYAFSSDKYEPMEQDIEFAPADISIYDTYLKFNDDLALRRIPRLMAQTIVNGLHVRFSSDGLTCNVPDKIINYKESNILCNYDYNLFALQDWRDRIKDYKDKSFRFKFSPISYNIDDIIHILTEYSINSENHFIIGGNLQKEAITEVIDFGKNHKDSIRVELLYQLDFDNKEIFEKQIIHSLNTVLALKNAKTRIHSYIDPHNINEFTAYLNTMAYWSNRNHSDYSFNYFLINVRKQGTATRNFNAMAESNEEIKYLLNIKPSEWRSTE